MQEHQPTTETPPPLTFQDLQKHIHDRYHATDSARGTPATFMWLIEEIGELATALHHKDDPAHRANLEEEFADVIAWLTTLANITNVDLESALRTKYLSNQPPKGTK